MLYCSGGSSLHASAICRRSQTSSSTKCIGERRNNGEESWINIVFVASIASA